MDAISDPRPGGGLPSVFGGLDSNIALKRRVISLVFVHQSPDQGGGVQVALDLGTYIEYKFGLFVGFKPVLWNSLIGARI